MYNRINTRGTDHKLSLFCGDEWWILMMDFSPPPLLSCAILHYKGDVKRANVSECGCPDCFAIRCCCYKCGATKCLWCGDDDLCKVRTCCFHTEIDNKVHHMQCCCIKGMLDGAKKGDDYGSGAASGAGGGAAPPAAATGAPPGTDMVR